MKNHFLLVILSFFTSFNSLNAQMNVGSASAPDASAQLQISTTTKGLLMPKVALTSTTNFGLTGNTQTAGISVYNTTQGITGTTTYPATGVGVYTWDGTGWVTANGITPPNVLGSAIYLKASTNTSLPGSTAITPVNFGVVVYCSSDISYNATTNVITVNKAGTYVASMQTSWINISANQQLVAGIVDISSGQWIGRGSHYAATATSGTTGELHYITCPVVLTAGQQIRFGVNATTPATILAIESGTSGTGTCTNALLQRIGN